MNSRSSLRIPHAVIALLFADGRINISYTLCGVRQGLKQWNVWITSNDSHSAFSGMCASFLMDVQMAKVSMCVARCQLSGIASQWHGLWQVCFRLLPRHVQGRVLARCGVLAVGMLEVPFRACLYMPLEAKNGLLDVL